MLVGRSALQSRAARSAAVRAAGSTRSAIQAARRWSRRTLSATDPSFSWKMMWLQLGEPVGQRALPILAEEELRVVQAGAQDALVALADQLHVLGPHVGDGHEVREQIPDGVHHREVTLVFLHRGHDDLARELQVLRLEGAADGGGEFDEVRHRLHQGLVQDRPALDVRGGLGRLSAHQLPPAGRVDDHKPTLENVEVFLKAAHASTARGQEAVAVGLAVGREAVHRERHHPTIEDRQQPPDGPDEPDRALAPAHELGEGERAEQFRQGRRQNVAGAAALLFLESDHIFATLQRADLQGLDGDPLGPGESLGGLGRPSLGVEGHRLGRPNHLSAHVRLALRQAIHEEDQAGAACPACGSCRRPVAARRTGGAPRPSVPPAQAGGSRRGSPPCRSRRAVPCP